MKPGISRFNHFLGLLQPLLTSAAKQKNPALWLYRNDARTPLFMLESLAKMYAGFHNNKKFTKIGAHFKLLEDGIGAIDYYDAMAKDMSVNKKIPAAIIDYLHAQSREKVQHLNEILAEKGWLTATENRITKIQKKLGEVDWMHEEDELKAIKDFYGEAIYKIVEFAKDTHYGFTDMEEQVHELRRKLRWLSIYPQALQGAVQLGKNKTIPKHLTKYLTEEIVNSSFNKMPDKRAAKFVLNLEQNYFYALSWMIARLGNIKDQGLHIVAVKEAIQQSSPIGETEAFKKVYQLLGNKQPKMQALLDEAGSICKIYFKEQNLEHLVMDVFPVS